MYINSTREGLHHPSLKSLVSAKKFGSPQWPIAQYEFQIWITRRIRNRIRKKCSKVNRGLNGGDLSIKPEDKISRYCPFNKGFVPEGKSVQKHCDQWESCSSFSTCYYFNKYKRCPLLHFYANCLALVARATTGESLLSSGSGNVEKHCCKFG